MDLRSREQVDKEYVKTVVGFTDAMAVNAKDHHGISLINREVVEVRITFVNVTHYRASWFYSID